MQFETLSAQEMVEITGGEDSNVAYAVGWLAGAVVGAAVTVGTAIMEAGATVGEMKYSGDWQG